MENYYVAIAMICFIMSLVAILLPFLLISNAKSEFNGKMSNIEVKYSGYETDRTSMRTEMQNLKFTYYEELAQAQGAIKAEQITIKSEMEATKTSVATFYSKWARKIGQLAPQPIEEELPPETSQGQLELPDGFALEKTTQAPAASTNGNIRGFRKSLGR